VLYRPAGGVPRIVDPAGEVEGSRLDRQRTDQEPLDLRLGDFDRELTLADPPADVVIHRECPDQGKCGAQ
jgi:hypothetical protein